jgi:hypothetical protein
MVRVAPIFPVSDLDAALAFYQRLGHRVGSARGRAHRSRRQCHPVRLPDGVTDRPHMGTLMPRFTSHAFAGQEVAKPIIMPTCISSQNAAELGIS